MHERVCGCVGGLETTRPYAALLCPTHAHRQVTQVLFFGEQIGNRLATNMGIQPKSAANEMCDKTLLQQNLAKLINSLKIENTKHRKNCETIAITQRKALL